MDTGINKKQTCPYSLHPHGGKGRTETNKNINVGTSVRQIHYRDLEQRDRRKALAVFRVRESLLKDMAFQLSSDGQSEPAT